MGYNYDDGTYNYGYQKGYQDGTRYGGCLGRIIALGLAISIMIGSLVSCNNQKSKKNKETLNSTSVSNDIDETNSNTKDELDEAVQKTGDDLVEAFGNYLSAQADIWAYNNHVDSAVRVAKNEAKIFLQNKGLLKLDYDGDFYIVDEKEWPNVNFCVYNATTGEYDKDALAKIYSCYKSIDSISSIKACKIYQKAYYINSKGEKKYLNESSFYELLGIEKVDDLKSLLGDYFISTEGYIFSDDETMSYTDTTTCSYSFNHMSNDDYGTVVSYGEETAYARTRKM